MFIYTLIDYDLERLHQIRRTTRVLSNAAKEVSRKGSSVWFLCIINILSLLIVERKKDL